MPERVAVTSREDLMNARARTKRYPIRALRYWWARRALIDEMKSRSEDLLIADMGCNRGHVKKFAGEKVAAGSKWIGLDWNIDPYALDECDYSELHECDFDQPLPLPDDSVDVVIFLHVIEHLPRPQFTMAEIGRILRPGGLLIAGSPIAPALVAKLRERCLRRRLKKGLIRWGGHINSMDCGRWRKLALLGDMQVERMAGTFLVRCSKNPLENHQCWIRLNQIWGAVFPALGGELYLTVRKRGPNQNLPAYSPAKGFVWHLLRPANALALLLLLVASTFLDFGMETRSEADQLSAVFDPHRGSNNDLYILRHAAIAGMEEVDDIGMIECPKTLERQFAESDGNGQDAYFLVSENAESEVMETIESLKLKAVDEVVLQGMRFTLYADSIEGSNSE